MASVKDRYSLSKPDSDKSTYHVILDLKGSDIKYTVGDSIAIHPKNDMEVVQKTLDAIRATGTEMVSDKHNEGVYVFRDFLEQKVDLSDLSKKMITVVAEAQTNPVKKEALLQLIAEGNREQLKAFQASREVWDFLQENQEVPFTPQELVQVMQPQLPRFYSIASSQAVVGDEVHLTVAELIYESNGHTRRGICTHYLCRLAPLHAQEIPIYVQASKDFHLPTDPNVPIIMIGPGTGVAPFRAFMQERFARGDKGSSWLFFGERYRNKTFFYEEDWQEWEKTNLFRIDTAFSRDQAHKIYVQHLMLEKGKELYDWIKNGAIIYVCGDALEMAKDVDAALHKIVETYTPCSEAEAKEFVKALRKSGKYLRDVY